MNKQLIPKILWIAFVLHSISFSLFLLGIYTKSITIDNKAFILFLIFGLINTIAFGEIVLKKKSHERKSKGI